MTRTHFGLTRHQQDATGHDSQRGRYIEVETSQGWDPWPLFCEHWPTVAPSDHH